MAGHNSHWIREGSTWQMCRAPTVDDPKLRAELFDHPQPVRGHRRFLVLQPQQNTTFAGDGTWFVQVTAGITGWFSRTVALLVAGWWLVRRPYPADRDTPRLVSVSAG
jgi:hypothetical protein